MDECELGAWWWLWAWLWAEKLVVVLLSVVGAGDADEPAWVPRRRASRTCAGCVGEGLEGSGEWIIWCGGEDSAESSSELLVVLVLAMVVGAKVGCSAGVDVEFVVK